MVQGLAWGTGTSIARHGVDAVLGSGSSAQAPAPAAAAPTAQARGPCELDQSAFVECLRANPGNAGQCELYFQALQTCQLNGGFR
jgi:hypothetical protein